MKRISAATPYLVPQKTLEAAGSDIVIKLVFSNVDKCRTHEEFCALLLMCSGDFIVLSGGQLLLFF